jgi:F0F1-type ATP synthase assembly protein I
LDHTVEQHLDPDDRSRVAKAYDWASKIISVSIGMVVPAVVGHWIDRRLGTGPLLLVVGSILGLLVGMKNLLRMTRVT